MPRCVFINLDQATQRRAAVEASFSAARPLNWSLHRFAAIGPGHPDITLAEGAAQQACFLSHREAVRESLGHKGPVFIVEDDVAFSPTTFPAADALLARNNPDWDILLTDLAVLETDFLATALRERREAIASQGHKVFELAGRRFVGTTAYLVREASKQKVFDVFSSGSIPRAPDLYLREAGAARRLKIAFCLPFITTIGPHADSSQIQGVNGLDQTLNLYRRLLYVDRDLDQCRRDADALLGGVSDEARVMGALFASIISPRGA